MTRGRLTIGLFNTYDKLKLSEAHRRAVARVGPLAHAYNMNVALIEFPLKKLVTKNVSEWVSSTTSIGEGGRYLEEIFDSDRLHIVNQYKNGFPAHLGKPVATTCNPFENRSVDAEFVASEASEGETMLLVFGLGPHGLPQDVKNACPYHLDITEKGVSLETCTALGAVVGTVGLEMKRF